MRMNPTRRHSILALLLCLALCFAAGWFGAQFKPGEWYDQLAKPSWTPPNWLFGPVWGVLYVTMGLSAWLVWQQVGVRKATLAFVFFVVQLLLNAAWSWVFFGLRRPGLAFGDIVLLWAAILVTLVLFWRRRPLSGGLLIPYLIWVSFAAALNLSLWRLNA